MSIPKNDDFNGERTEGTGYWDLATWNGKRSSTDRACLKDARKRPNLNVVTEALVSKIEFDGRRATGVVYRKGGHQFTISARRDIVLSAGALHTRQLLQVSGVGPGALLQNLGIDVVHDPRGVGENLMTTSNTA